MPQEISKTCRAFLILGLLITALFAAAPGGGIRAQELSPIEAAGPEPPRLRLLHSNESDIHLRATLSGLTVREVEAAGETYTLLTGEGYGHPSAIGRPDLPVLRRGVEIPFGAEVEVEIEAADYTDYPLDHPVLPLQPPLPKCGSLQVPFEIDRPFYADGSPYPASPVTLGEPYVVRGHRVQPVEVWPASYDPGAGTIRIYHRIVFHLRLAGSDMARTRALARRFASPAFENSLARQIVNYNQGRPPLRFHPDAQAGYLIITADAYYDAMLPFVNLRDSRGFDVTITRISEIPGGGSNTAIRDYIADAYWNWPTPPSYVLLVGDTDTVPGWTGPATGEVVDLYYGCMDGEDDWHPDLGRGRFPVRSAAQTTAMVNKYLAYAGFAGDEPWLKKAAFIATCDQYQVAEGTHNYVIDNYTEPNGYTGIFPNDPEPGGDKIYCVTYNGSSVNITNAANDGRWAIVYSGHGAPSGWADGQVSFSQSDVESLGDYGFFPFVAGHACNTGRFDTSPEAFCETWVLQEDKGSLIYWGSADFSYWDEDDVLERGMFDSLFDSTDGYPTVAEMTDYGLAATEAAYPSSAQYYWETYNVMGDPAVKIFMEPDLPTFYMEVTPIRHEVCDSGTVTSTVRVESLLGYSETVHLEAAAPPTGISLLFAPPSAQAPFTSVLTITVASATPPGEYALLITATDNVSWTQGEVIELQVADGPPVSPTLTTPPDGAMDQPLQPTLGWLPPPLASVYNLQLATGPLFEAPLLDLSGLQGTEYTPSSPLDGGRCYWWHAQAGNVCGTGEWAEPFHFATVLLEAVFADDIEAGGGNWDHGAAQGTDNWAISEAQSHSPTHAWFVPDDPVVTDSRLWTVAPIQVGNGSTLTFWHIHQFEYSYDGAVLEISTDGDTWIDLGPYITANGYNGTISTCCDNPLGGREAWVSDLAEWAQVEVDLSGFAGESVYIRWRIGCDYSVSDVGWYIDDVQVIVPQPPNPAPLLQSITPDVGTPYQPVPVQIAGEGFVERPAARLGETWLLSVTQVTTRLLTGVVPAGMPPGLYDLTLVNGDCQEGVLPNAFTVVGECISPTLSLSAAGPVELGGPMHFTATVVTGTPPFTYTWDFGGPGYGSGLDTPNPVYTYTETGVYTVTAAVTNPCGSDDANVLAEVFCTAPMAVITAGSPVVLGEPMHFTGTVTGTPPFTYTWDFGGPGYGSGLDTPNPVYTYTLYGGFSVTLTVTSPCGAAASTVGVYVEPVRRLYLPVVRREG